MVAYYDIGATSLLIRGYDPLPDAIEYVTEAESERRPLLAGLVEVMKKYVGDEAATGKE